MHTIAKVLVFMVAIQHLLFMYLEMFLWTRPRGRKLFGLTREKAEITRALAANQGLYNGFLAAGLAWGLLHPDSGTGMQIQLFFLICILIAAFYGGMSVNRKILYLQGLPALAALLSLLVPTISA